MEDLSLDFDIQLPDPGGFDAEELVAGLTMDDFSGFGGPETTRYIRPAFDRGIPDRCVMYRHAAKFAEDIQFRRGERITAIVSGDFIFGDFLEALMVQHNIHAKRMIVATLSYSQNNVDSLANLLQGGFVDQLDLITSVYFWGHERGKGRLIPYTYQQLDKDDRFQLAVCGSHCKYALIETHSGAKIVIHGSANLRSSGCLEQVTIEEGSEMYSFLEEASDRILEAYKTIDKPVFRAKLWRAINGQGAEESRMEAARG